MGSPPTSTARPELTLEELEFIRRQRKENEWKSFVDTEYTRAKNARSPFERQWFINLAFYSGRQYVAPINIPGHGFRLTAPKAPAHRVRLVINLVRRAVRKECAKLTSSKPIPTVVPATNEDEDQTAAIVSETVLKAQFGNSKFESLYRLWIWWGVVTGSGFIKSYYDENEPDYDCMQLPDVELPPGVTIEVLEKINPKMAAFLKTPQPAKGRVCYSLVTPFNLYVPDLMVPDIQDQPYVIHILTKSPEWVRARFGFTPNCDARSANTALDAATIIAKGRESATTDAVLVKECWIKPGGHKDFPEGGLITIINDKVVQVRDKWPVPFPEFPFYQYKGIPSGGFYDDSVIVDLIPMQKEYNRTRSQMVEIKNTMGKPRLLYEKGSINPRMLSSEPGQSVPFTPGYNPPQVMPGVEYPQSMVNEVETLRSEFDDISGQHEVSNGETPAGVTSGTALAFLSEQDESSLSYQVAGIEYACEILGSHHLKYATTYWEDNRVIRITGRNNTFESIHWKKNAMEGNTDVRVQTGSALPQSKAARQALITEMMQNGFLAPEVGLEIMDFGGFDKAMEDYLVDKRQAMRENLKMQSGSDQMFELLMKPSPDMEPQMDDTGRMIVLDPNTGQYVPWQPQPPIPVNSWDNHEAHIKWHDQYRKGQEFEMLSETKKKAFELHVQAHKTAMMYDQVNMQGTLLQQGQFQPGMETQDPTGGEPTGPESDPNALGSPVGTPSGGPLASSTGALQEQYHREQGIR